MKRKRMLSALLVVAMAATMFAGCGNKGGSNSSTQGGKAANDGDIKEFTAFFAVPGSEINDDNEVQQIIAEKTGVKVKETWLTGQTAEEAIGTLVAGDEYPDFICGGNGMPQLYDAGALVALDDYIDKYPNIKNYFTEQEWDQLRQDDGHIYWIPQFSNIKGEEKTCTHNDAINSVFWANNLDPPKTHNSNMIMNDFICLSFNSLLSLWKNVQSYQFFSIFIFFAF